MFGAAATHLIEIDQIHEDTTEGETVHHEFYIPTPIVSTKPMQATQHFSHSIHYIFNSVIIFRISSCNQTKVSKGKFAELKKRVGLSFMVGRSRK